jgi:hypothetical protein
MLRLFVQPLILLITHIPSFDSLSHSPHIHNPVSNITVQTSAATMTFEEPSKELATSHEEWAPDITPPLDRRRSTVAEIVHTEQPVWEQRQTYSKHGMLPTRSISARRLISRLGFMGIFTSKYVFLCAAFATMGGLLFGYEYVALSTLLGEIGVADSLPQPRSGLYHSRHAAIS